MSGFVSEALSAALGQLEERRRKLEPMLREAAELDRAIKAQRKLVAQLGGAAEGARPRPPASAPASASASAGEGSQAERALRVLRGHPRGLAAAVVAREAGIPAGSIQWVLGELTKRSEVERVGRGFYRVPEAAGNGASAG